MNKFIVYIQTAEEKIWRSQLSDKVKEAFKLRLDIEIDLASSSEHFIEKLHEPNKIGIYLPLISSNFVMNSDITEKYKQIKNLIDTRFSNNALTLALLIELFPDNQALFQPLFKFYLPNKEHLNFENLNQIENIEIENNLKLLMKKIEVSLNTLNSSKNEQKHIFIGAVTSDLKETSSQLYNFLLNNNIAVANPIDYNQDKITITNNIKQRITNSWLVIHACSIGFLEAINKNSTTETIFELEYQLSTEIYEEQKKSDTDIPPLKRILWLPYKPSSSSYEGRLLDRIMSSSESSKNIDVLNCSFEELKQIILSYHQKEFDDSEPQIENDEEKTCIEIDENTVYIMYDKQYKKHVNAVKEYFSKQKITAYVLDDFINIIEGFNNIQETLLQKCKGVLILASSWNTNWYKYNFNEVLRSKIRRVDKIDFICTVSNEIEQLPSDFEQHSLLYELDDILKEKRQLPL